MIEIAIVLIIEKKSLVFWREANELIFAHI